MPKIFCCYRRGDSTHQAGRIFDHLAAHFGKDGLFKDVDSMPVGLDFRRVLSEKVAQCDLLLALIGDGWLNAAEAAGRRIDNPCDFVRIEIESALRRNIPVVPVLVGQAPLPQADDLPEALRELAFRHGLPIRPDPDFHRDVERLIRGINDVLGDRAVPTPTPAPPPRGKAPIAGLRIGKLACLLQVTLACLLAGVGYILAAVFYYNLVASPPNGTGPKLPITAIPDKDNLPTSASTNLKLELDSFSGYCIFRSDEFKKKLAENGLNLECVDDGADYAARMKAVQSGEAPLAVFTIDALINNTPSVGDPPATIILVIDESRGDDAMIGLKPGTPDIDSLNREDQKIVLVEGSPSETLARVVRSQFSLPNLPVLKKEYLIPANDSEVNDVYKRFLKAAPSEHKAFVLWEPLVSKALHERPEARILVDSSQFKGYIVDVLVAQPAWLRGHAVEAKAAVQSYLEVLHAHQSADGMASLVLSDAVDMLHEKLTPEEAAQVAKGTWWKNAVENYAHFGLLSPDRSKRLQRLDEMIHNIMVVLDQTKQPGEPAPGLARPDELYDDSVLQQLYDQRPSFMIGEATILVEAAAPPLNDDDWASLQTVGLFKEDPIAFKGGVAVFSDEDDAQLQLADVADKMRRWPQCYLRVEGNTLGDDNDVNRALVKDRANAVKDFLVTRLFVDEHRIRAVGNKPGQGKGVDFVMLRKAR